MKKEDGTSKVVLKTLNLSLFCSDCCDQASRQRRQSSRSASVRFPGNLSGFCFPTLFQGRRQQQGTKSSTKLLLSSCQVLLLFQLQSEVLLVFHHHQQLNPFLFHSFATESISCHRLYHYCFCCVRASPLFISSRLIASLPRCFNLLLINTAVHQPPPTPTPTPVSLSPSPVLLLSSSSGRRRRRRRGILQLLSPLSLLLLLLLFMAAVIYFLPAADYGGGT